MNQRLRGICNRNIDRSMFEKHRVFSKDWFLGLVTVLIVLVLYQTTAVFEQMENWIYDPGVQASSHPISDKVAFIAIDDASILAIGRWPWSREVHAQFIDKLAVGKPKSIAYTVAFTEPQRDAGLGYINKLAQSFYIKAEEQGFTSSPSIAQMGKCHCRGANSARR